MANEKMSLMALACLGQKQEIAPAPAIDLQELVDVYNRLAEVQAETGGTVQYRVKIPSGGGKAFDILTGDEEMDTSVPTFAGVILYHHRCNARFDETVSGNTPPLCSSVDGKSGFEVETGAVHRCAGCQYNEYGSSAKGRGKACKNMHRLYIMTPGVSVPLVLRLPPTGLKGVQTYLANTLAVRQLRPEEVLTEFSIAVTQNSDGIKYSVVKFKLLGKLEESDRAAAQVLADAMKRAAANVGIDAEDYDRRAAEPSMDVEPDPEDFVK